MKSIDQILANTKEVWYLFVLPKPCREWQRGTFNSGYGRVWYQSTWHLVHRLLYETFVGPIPEGKELDHICQNKLCCEPTHLEPVSHRENVRRGDSVPAWNARKTHCSRGHLFDEANTRYRSGINRVCRKCHVEKVTESRRQKRKANPSPFGKGKTSHCALKTHCPKGHPLSGENLYVQPNGGRVCRTCSRAKVQAYRARKKASEASKETPDQL